MSKNRKKKSTNRKKPNNRKRVQKKKKMTPIDHIKTFFNEMISKIKNDIKLDKLINKDEIVGYVKNNKQGIIFTMAMISIVAVGYFAFVYEAPEKPIATNNETVSIDLSEEETDFMDSVEGELEHVSLGDSTEEVENVTPLAETSDQADTVVLAVEESDESMTDSYDVAIEVTDAVDEEELKELLSEDSIEPVQEDTFGMTSVEDSIMLGIDVYAILVDEEPVAYFETQGEAFLVLKELKNKYKQEDATEEEIIFREDIAIEKVKLDVLDFHGYRTREEVVEYIVKGTNEQRIHVVEPGENFWVIAEQYGLNVNNLIDANPDINPLRLQIAEELSLIVPEPLINVVTISTVERIDPIPYGRAANVKTDKYYEGTYRPKVNGVNGEAENVVQVYMENGKIIGEKVVSSNVIKEPIDMVMYEGTKEAPPLIGTGTFQKPTSRGYVTSRFGPRSLGYHNGIDIGLPMRTDVFAADGGVVLFAGYKGSFGKLVMIDHGKNTISYYAHLDETLVKAGQRVPKGHLIALSGNTGRSTGPHLHFEIRINGSAQNPAKFVTY